MSSRQGTALTSKGMQPLRGFAIAVAGAALLAHPARAHVYQYDDTPGAAVTIPDPGSDDAGNCSVTFIDRTFVVPASDSFTVARIAVGLSVAHTNRGDLRVEIFRPGSATPLVALPGDTGGGDDDDDNYDILMSSNSDAGEDGTAPVDDEDEDPVAAPFFNRLVTVAGIDFYTGNSVGTWTLRICDVDSSGGSSSYNRARLILESDTAAGSLCTSRMTYNWGANGNNAGFTSASTGDVTITETVTTNYSGGTNSAGNGWFNFATDTDSLGGHAGYYSIYMDAQATAGTQDSEVLGQLVTFTFSSAAQDLEFSTLDSDQADDDFEDILRIEGDAVGGGHARYGRTSPDATPNFQIAGDGIEGDSACDNGSNCATETYKFDRALTAVTIHYDAADDLPSEPGDQLVGISDFSFCAFDYGDAPNTYGDQLNNGPKHVLGNRLLYIGTNRPDGESNGQPGTNANTDDTTQVTGSGVDDEDGVASFSSCPGDGTYSVTVNATNNSGATGYLVGYIDWNRDGDFADSGERSTTKTVANGTNGVNQAVLWSSGVPAVCGGNTATYARFRFTTTQARAESPTDAAGTQAPDGEVEDYLIAAGTLPVTVARVESSLSGRSLNVRWTTATETANAGFRIWSVDEKGRRTLLGNVKTQGADSFTPQHYEADFAAGPGTVGVLIEDLSLFGVSRRHGPFAVGKAFGEEPAGAAIDWASVKSEARIVSDADRIVAAEAGQSPAPFAVRRSASVTGGGSASGLLLVRNEGIQRVTYEQLLAAGVDLSGADPEAIALLDDGIGRPRFVSTVGKTFGPGSFIEFVARPRLTLESPVDAIVVTADGGAAAVPVGSLLALGGNPAMVRATELHAADAVYSFAAPNGDPWYEQNLLAWGGPASLSRGFDLPNLARGQVWLTLKTWGYGDFPGDKPDHHVIVRVNGTEVANARFDGVTPWNRTIEVSSLVKAQGNVFEVLVPGDTGFEYDFVAFDGFSLSYSRQSVALDQRLQGSIVAPFGASLGGFADGQPVSIWNLPATNAPSVLSGTFRSAQLPVGGAVRAAATGTLFAAAESALFTPAVVAGVPEAQTSSTAQYVIVTHPAFAQLLGNLVALEHSRGFTTEVVTTDRIFAAYSDHVSSAEAVKSFLLASAAHKTLRYVLVVGTDTTDPYDHLGTGSVSYVPTKYLPYAQFIAFSPTDEALVDADGDGLGEVPIGRLPVKTPAELDAVVAKLIAWESRHSQPGGPPAGNAVLVAGASGAEAGLSPANESFQNALQGWNTRLIEVDTLGTEAARQAVLAALHGGTTLVSYVGHSSPGQWDSSPILKWQDAPGLGNHGQPNLVAQWGCWNSYYVEPGYESLSARLLRADAGPAGAIGASTLLPQASQQELGRLFFARVDGGAATVGTALREAKRDLMSRIGATDVVQGTMLLGDPAMSLPSPPGH